MNIKSALTLPFLFFITSQAFAIDPFYDGANGIREQVFAPNCLSCHSSALTGAARNGAPPSVNLDTYEAAFPYAARTMVVVRSMDQMTTQPSPNDISQLSADQKTAIFQWEANGFPKDATSTVSTGAAFSYDSSILTIPVVNVGAQKFQATLRLISMDSSPTGIGFVLESAAPTTASSDNAATYVPETGQVILPSVDLLQNGVSQGRVSAQLAFVTGSNPSQFILTSYTPIP